MVKALPLRLLVKPSRAVNDRERGHFQAIVLYTKGGEGTGWRQIAVRMGRLRADHSTA